MKRKRICVLLLLLGISSAAFAQTDNSDSLTITTYYPSPYGVYRNVRLYPSNEPAGAAKQPGVMYFDLGNKTIYYYNGSDWIDMGNGGAGGLWAENKTTHDIYNINSGGNVGIGTSNPVARLEVAGPALIGAKSETFAAEAGRITTEESFFSGVLRDALIIEKTDDDPSVDGGIIMGFSTSGNWNTPVGDPGWAINRMPVLVLRGSGNVGIGTLEPEAALEVNGTVRSGPPGQVHNGAGVSKTIRVSDLQDYHTSLPDPFPDPTLASVANLMCSIAACNRYCGNGCSGAINGCNGDQPGLGYHGGTAVEWNSISQLIMCNCF